MEQKEITTPLSVLDDSGLPANFGWSRKPSFFYDPVMVFAPRYKLTESDRYIIQSPTHQVIFEIRDDGFIGYMGVTVISLRDKKRSTKSFTTLFPLGSYELPTSSVTGSIRWRKKGNHLDFINMDDGSKIIKADISGSGRHRNLRCQLVLQQPKDADSLVVNQAWRGEKYAFKYSRVSPWYTVEGVVQLGGSEIIFTKGNGWGIFDWNRCIRPKSDIRYWASACGIVEGRQISLSIGYSQADFSYGTENGVFVDGILHKLEQVTFHIPLANWLSTWRFTSNDNRIEMTFTPHQERVDRRSLLFYVSTRHQVCGFFSGKAVLDDGSIVEFHKLTGFAERCRVRF